MAAARISKIWRQISVERRPRHELRTVFNQYDTDQDGYINVEELEQLVNNQTIQQSVPRHVIMRLLSIGDRNNDGRLDFNEFYNLIETREFWPIFGKLLDRYVSILVPKNTLKVRRDYHDKARCCPPPLGMVSISLLQVILFVANHSLQNVTNGRGPIADKLIYDPERRYEAWRFLTYMFVHDGYYHLVVNLVVQLFLGIILEMVNRWWRLLIIYSAGVVAGSLGASIVDPESILQGASGGVYAIFTAHIASIIMNWKDMDYPFVQMLIFVFLVCFDIGNAIYQRHYIHITDRVSYVAHLSGAISGLLIGISVVQNVKVTKKENVIWWISLVTFTVLMGVGVVWHIAAKEYFPKQAYEMT